MSVIDFLKESAGIQLIDEDDGVDELTLLPGLSEEELAELERRLPCALPNEIRELLSFCRGFEPVLESVDFSGNLGGFGLEEIFPFAIPIAHDGFGNYWVVDITSSSTSWGPIYYACHDAPVIVFQTDSLEHFVREIVRFGNEPWESEINDIHEKYHDRIWKENPDMMTYQACLNSGDTDLVEFAKSLDSSYLFCDLRDAKIGDGFSWGRYGAWTVNVRFGEKRIFAYQIREHWWKRLFARKK
jgi:hypothetical protein